MTEPKPYNLNYAGDWETLFEDAIMVIRQGDAANPLTRAFVQDALSKIVKAKRGLPLGVYDANRWSGGPERWGR